MRIRIGLVCVIIAVAGLLVPRAAGSRETAAARSTQGMDQARQVLVFDGSPVHNVGELHMHMSNWGMFGSMPNTGMPFAFAPSAEWPAGSGVEHLFSGGIWVGALKSGVPQVTTSTFESEFRPTQDPIDIVYRSAEGAPQGDRFPFPGADDDGDGSYDEDWLDGHDNDGDALIDEDFAAVSTQMFSRWYTDNNPLSKEQYPAHDPLDIMVREESYQWADDEFDDFVGIEYVITNIGDDVLENVYIALFADPDIGKRATSQNWLDDAAGFSDQLLCTPLGAAGFQTAYAYDYDGDGGQAPSYIGIMILDHLVDPTGEYAPSEVGVASFHHFRGEQSYEEGGDPTNDFERYELMSSGSIDRDGDSPGDYRMLISVGPFKELAPGQELVIRAAVVAGQGLAGLLQNAARAQLAFNGKWFDIDEELLTGIAGRETPVTGPATGIVIDRCDPNHDDPINVPRGVTVWTNDDCEDELFRAEACKYGAQDSLIYKTGVAGKETNVNWTISDEMPAVTRTAYMDIKPGSYPNPFNLHLFEFMLGDNPKKGGVLPIAVLGQETFDVHDIDVSTLRLEGAAPLPHGQDYEDVASVSGNTGCPFTSDETDGFPDLMLKFRNIEVAAGIVQNGLILEDGMQLTLTGNMMDGTPFAAHDCVKLVGEGQGPPDDQERGKKGPTLRQPSPNPFNPVARISYYLPEEGHVRIAVFDVAGKLVELLYEGYQTAGEQSVEWDGSRQASGLYFYRLEANGQVDVKRAVLIK
ncbi:MAG: T9SS type A sorting domain-containing protein [Chitinivibrionia bacterium]|nr:T9SS type A sorting domain-containing protein [Chitinivibrionia bacterium]